MAHHVRRTAQGLALGLLLALAATAQAQEDVKAAPSCGHCGMDREKFASSRMVLQYEDGTSAGVCSIHCAAVDLAVTLDKAPKAILVADLGTRQLVDAEQATWVIGGTKQGVMSRRGKWAFATRAAAEAFAKENGGTLASFDEAMKAAYEDLWQDTRMIREKRKMMRQKAAERAAPAQPTMPAVPAVPASPHAGHAGHAEPQH